jgi:hypothetical protein
MMQSPLHVAEIDGKRLRFFKTPLKDGKPDFPWHSVADLFTAMGLPPHDVQAFLEMRPPPPFPQRETVATAEGPVVIAPHYQAQSFIDALIDYGKAPKSFAKDYLNASIAVMAILARALGLRPEEKPFWGMAAMTRWAEEPSPSSDSNNDNDAQALTPMKSRYSPPTARRRLISGTARWKSADCSVTTAASIRWRAGNITRSATTSGLALGATIGANVKASCACPATRYSASPAWSGASAVLSRWPTSPRKCRAWKPGSCISAGGRSRNGRSAASGDAGRCLKRETVVDDDADHAGGTAYSRRARRARTHPS